MDKDKLMGIDYLTTPVTELCNHPDYSPHAMEVVHTIAQMNTEQLDEIQIRGE